MSINQNKFQRSSYFMSLALAQAQINLGNTSDNPSVGCVIAKKNHLVGAGFTSKKGRPHAEINAIKFSKKKLDNSELYVTLEPCSHHGKTPPCVNSIIRNNIKRVFFSIKDPDLRSFNKSASLLRRNGISVIKGVYKKRIFFFYKSYLKFKKKNLPFVTCKLAISKDYYSINIKDKWITNKYSRGRVHLMRSYHDCIITSSKTVNKDNPRLTCRINGLFHNSPTRIIFDKKLNMRANSKIVKEANNFRTIIFYHKINWRKIKLLKKFRIQTYKISLDSDGNLDLIESLNKVRKLGFSRTFLESGIKLTTSFLKNGLVDELKIFISNKKLAKNGRGNIKNFLKKFLINKKKIIEKVNLFNDILTTYKLK